MCSTCMLSLVHLTTMFYFHPKPLIRIAGARIVDARYANVTRRIEVFSSIHNASIKTRSPQRYRTRFYKMNCDTLALKLLTKSVSMGTILTRNEEMVSNKDISLWMHTPLVGVGDRPRYGVSEVVRDGQPMNPDAPPAGLLVGRSSRTALSLPFFAPSLN